MPPDRALAEHLDAALRASTPGTVDLAAIAAFDWDRAFVFPAYACPEFIERRLGFRWDGCEASATTVQDRYQLLAFVKGRAVVRWMDHDQGEGAGTFSVGDRPIERSHALLDVDRDHTITVRGNATPLQPPAPNRP